ncbi:MAG TPA: hypothetical protein VHZ03_37515 [Trebonia sp.]|nr:hypothetical protein [Trebonia sp.]
MNFAPDFWVATAAATPVIALSAIVLINDQGSIFADAQSKKILFGSFIGTLRRAAFISYFLNSINLVLQSVIFGYSLVSLALETDFIPKIIAAIAENSSIGFLFFSTIIIVICKAKIKVEGNKITSQEVRQARNRLETYNQRKMISARRTLLKVGSTSRSISKAHRNDRATN